MDPLEPISYVVAAQFPKEEVDTVESFPQPTGETALLAVEPTALAGSPCPRCHRTVEWVDSFEGKPMAMPCACIFWHQEGSHA